MKKIAALLRDDEDEREDLTLPPHTNAFNIDDCDDIPVGVTGFEYDDDD